MGVGRVAKVKGTNVLGTVKALKAYREQATAKLPERLMHYLDDRILVSSWYPEVDQIEMLRVLASLLPRTPSPWPLMGRMAAAQDLASVYRNQIRPDSPQQSLLASASLWRNYHDTGEMAATVDGPTAVLLRLRGYHGACKEMCEILGGYLGEMAAQAGGRDVTATKLDCVLKGQPQCSWRIAWSK